jgi:hypothetical protein
VGAGVRPGAVESRVGGEIGMPVSRLFENNWQKVTFKCDQGRSKM